MPKTPQIARQTLEHVIACLQAIHATEKAREGVSEDFVAGYEAALADAVEFLSMDAILEDMLGPAEPPIDRTLDHNSSLRYVVIRETTYYHDEWVGEGMDCQQVISHVTDTLGEVDSLDAIFEDDASQTIVRIYHPHCTHCLHVFLSSEHGATMDEAAELLSKHYDAEHGEGF